MEREKLSALLQGALKDRRLIRAAVILGIAGIVLIWLSTLSPSREPEPQPDEGTSQLTDTQYRQDLEEDLCRIVRAVTGEHEPQVMITLEDAGSGLYAADRSESMDGDSSQRESSYVIVKDSGGSEHGLSIRQSNPRVLGAVIVSKGAGDPAVREKLINAARAVLGIPAGRVFVVEGR